MKKNTIHFPEESRFLVTGGAGFIGSNICEAIVASGHFVRCLDDFSTGKPENIKHLKDNPLFELVEGDIRHMDTCMQACDGIDYVSHQAAWGSVPRSIKMPLVYEEINIRGTLNMMEAARQNMVKKFVYASSSSVYGDHPILPKVEGQEGQVLSPYAFTKRACEEYGALYAKLYDLETVGFRYFNVFGRRQDSEGYYAAVIPKFIQALLKNHAPIIHGDGLQSRDFTYIDNVVEANLRGMLAPPEVSGKAYNIAYGGQVTIIDLYQHLCTLLGKDIKPIFGNDRPGDVKHSKADISLARHDLGYDPQYDFYDGIEEAVDWYIRYLAIP